jgi:hypothetical protein
MNAKRYTDALSKGLSGKEAILWARVEAFRRSNGELEAGSERVGLFSICENPSNTYYTKRLRQYPMWSERWRWNCIALDQGRRMEAINKVLASDLRRMALRKPVRQSGRGVLLAGRNFYFQQSSKIENQFGRFSP